MESFSYGVEDSICVLYCWWQERGGVNDLSEPGDPSRQIETVTRTCKQAHVNVSTVSRLAWVRLHAEAAAQRSWIIGKQCAGLLSDFFFFFSLSFCHSWEVWGVFPGGCALSNSHTRRPLWQTAELLLYGTSKGRIPASWQKTQEQKKKKYRLMWGRLSLSNSGVEMRTFESLWYLLVSFSTSLSSSSFSLVMKLCSTGISNLMYCAT